MAEIDKQTWWRHLRQDTTCTILLCSLIDHPSPWKKRCLLNAYKNPSSRWQKISVKQKNGIFFQQQPIYRIILSQSWFWEKIRLRFRDVVFKEWANFRSFSFQWIMPAFSYPKTPPNFFYLLREILGKEIHFFVHGWAKHHRSTLADFYPPSRK